MQQRNPMKVPMEALFKFNLDELRLLEQRLLIKDETGLLSTVVLLKQFVGEFPEWSEWALVIRQWLIENGLSLSLETLRAAVNAIKNGTVDFRYMSGQFEINLRDLIEQTREAHDEARVLANIANGLWLSLEAEFRRASDKGYVLPWAELKQLKEEIHHV